VEQFASAFGAEEVAKVKSTVGLRQLHRVGPHQTAGDLSVEAANALLTDLDWDPKSIDGVIMVTQFPDYFCPATACVVHGKLGLSASAFAFDVNLGCSGYVYGMWLASQAVASGTAKRVLLLASDTPSRVLSPEDKSVALLFGDAGTATALELEASALPMSYVLGSDGVGYENLIVRAGGFRMRPTPEAFDRIKCEDGNVRSPMELYMDGLAIFNFTLQRVPALVRDTLEAHGWEIGQVDGFLCHQANAFMLRTLGKKMKLPVDRMPINIGKYGNTSMCSIPLLLADDYSERVRGSEPQKLLLASFGVGYSWAALAATLGEFKTARVINTEVTTKC
jgi:3-oxoacyl-[acyl-carrier-protein] synthase-3